MAKLFKSRKRKISLISNPFLYKIMGMKQSTSDLAKVDKKIKAFNFFMLFIKSPIFSM
jgi:hypothetical protein